MWILILSVVAVIVVAILVPRRVRASHDRPWVIAERALALGAIAWSVSVTMYLIVVPTYEGVPAEALGGVVERVTTGKRTFLEVNGVGAVVLLLVPILLTALPWLASDPTARRRLQILGTALLLAVVIVGALSEGLLYTPSALAMLITVALGTAGQRRP